MKWAIRLVLLAAIGGLMFWLWTVLFPSPQRIVLRIVSKLAATATIEPNDGRITRVGKAAQVVSDFSPDADIVIDVNEVGAHTLSGREEIHEAVMGGFVNISSLKVQFLDATAKVDPDKQTAEVDCTARVSAGNSKDFGIQEVRFNFKKIDGDWLITHAETVKTLE